MSKTTSYGARPIKRARRSRDDMGTLKIELSKVLSEIQPATLRQLYYQAVSRKLIPKTEQAYKTIGRVLVLMRRAGEIPYDWIADNTRWMRKPRTYSGLQQLLNNTAATYRRSVWDSQSAYVEIWLEKDALAGVLYPITSKYDVPLMVTRGYPSLSFLHSAAEAIKAEDKPTYLYYFGDMDPSGLDIPRKVEEGIRQMAPYVQVEFERVAVTRQQIVMFDLPTRPTKRTDSRAKTFEGESVEVDAIPPAGLRRLVRSKIESHINREALATLQIAEESERSYLENLAKRLEEGEQ